MMDGPDGADGTEGSDIHRYFIRISCTLMMMMEIYLMEHLMIMQ